MICSHTIVRNGADFVEPCLRQILPYVDRALVSVDLSSKDETIDILKRLEKEYKNLELSYFLSDNLKGLTEERNRQLEKTTEDWFWIVDGDEYYLKEDIEKILSDLDKKYICYEFSFWFPVSLTEHHYNYSRTFAPRIFRKEPEMKWKRAFPKETLHNKGLRIYSKTSPEIKRHNVRYIHFSHLKNWSWRKEYGYRFREYDKCKLPIKIINEIKLCLKNVECAKAQDLKK